MSFKPDDANAQNEAIRAMEDCIKDIRNWLIEGRLLLDDDGTEFLVIGTCHQLNKLNPSVLHVGDHTIDNSVNVRNLGTIFGISVSMDTHINQVCKTAFYHIHNIRRIFLNTFHSKLDTCSESSDNRTTLSGVAKVTWQLRKFR